MRQRKPKGEKHGQSQLQNLCEFISENGSPKLALSIATKWQTDNLGLGFIRYNNF